MDTSKLNESVTLQFKKILKLTDHTDCPGGRLKEHGKYSGEWFREDILIPVIDKLIQLQEDWKLEVDCTGGYGLPATWLDEITYPLNKRFSANVLDRITQILPKGHACDNASSCYVVEV